MIAKHWTTCVSIYYNKCKMLPMFKIFNILKVSGLTHIHMLTFEEMWKDSLIHSNINVSFEVDTCVIINYDKCKMQPMNNSFNM
jgi:hypothetical protein